MSSIKYSHVIVFSSISLQSTYSFFFFFFNDTATTEIYTLSLHDALPIFLERRRCGRGARGRTEPPLPLHRRRWRTSDRKSTRLNSSHPSISYAVFCLKKKKKHKKTKTHTTNNIMKTKLTPS